MCGKRMPRHHGVLQSRRSLRRHASLHRNTYRVGRGCHMNLVLAGPSFPCGVADLVAVGRKHGFQPVLLEHPHKRSDLHGDAAACIWADEIPSTLAHCSGVFLPLLESWVSAGLRLPPGSQLRFDRQSAAISRSKLALTAALQIAGLPSVPRMAVHNAEDALRSGRTLGGRMILRSDSGFSSRNVSYVGDPGKLLSCWDRYCAVASSPAAHKALAVLDVCSSQPVLEPWIEGAEWSLDCSINADAVFIIRLCEKVVTLVDSTPVTIGYRINTVPDVLARFQMAAQRWCSSLFRDPQRLGFACFDIRENAAGDLVPVDFGTRLGGDYVPRLTRHASPSRNPYAAALDAAFAQDDRLLAPLTHGWAVMHVYALQSGSLLELNSAAEHTVIQARPPGSHIRAELGNMKALRVATTMGHFHTYAQFADACRQAQASCRIAHHDKGAREHQDTGTEEEIP
jgi:hypothetical protein